MTGDISKGGHLQALARESVRSFKELSEFRTWSKDCGIVTNEMNRKKASQNSSWGREIGWNINEGWNGMGWDGMGREAGF
jgi:hypothetical protein